MRRWLRKLLRHYVACPRCGGAGRTWLRQGWQGGVQIACTLCGNTGKVPREKAAAFILSR